MTRAKTPKSGPTKAEQLENAVDHLNSLMEQGSYEWPDAIWRTTRKYGVDADQLTAAYDRRLDF